MSMEYYKTKRYTPAYRCLKEAFVLAPNNQAVAIGLLKVIAMQYKLEHQLQDEQIQTIKTCNALLSKSELSKEKRKEVNQYLTLLGVDIAA